MKIYYGVEDNYKDITKKVVFCNRDKENKSYIIPSNDVKRSELFGDHIYGVMKHILIITYNKDKDVYQIKRYNDDVDIFISRKEYMEL